MASALKLVSLLLGISFFFGLFAVSVTAQDDEEEPPAGSLYLGSVLKTYAELVPPSTCETVVYTMTMDAPTSATSQKAYGARGGGFGCVTFFEFEAVEAFKLAGSAAIRFFYACEPASATSGSPATVTARVGLYKNGAQWTTTTENAYTGPSNGCTTAPIEVSVTRPTKDTAFKVKDKFAVGIQFFAPTGGPKDPVKNLHILVGSTAHPSVVTAPGLPLPVSALPETPEVLTLAGPAEAPTGSANSTVDVALSVGNGGASEANFTLNATNVPEGFELSFDPSEGTIPANGTVNVTASIGIPDAAPGDYSFAIQVDGPNGGNATLSFVLTVTAEGAPSANETTQATNGTAGSPATDDEGGGVPGPGILASLAVMVGSALVWSRRRRAG